MRRMVSRMYICIYVYTACVGSNEYLSTIRQRAGQSLEAKKKIHAPKPHRVSPRGGRGGHDVNSLGWGPTDVVQIRKSVVSSDNIYI
jgi:hypothetical protein